MTSPLSTSLVRYKVRLLIQELTYLIFFLYGHSLNNRVRLDDIIFHWYWFLRFPQCVTIWFSCGIYMLKLFMICMYLRMSRLISRVFMAEVWGRISGYMWHTNGFLDLGIRCFNVFVACNNKYNIIYYLFRWLWCFWGTLF